MPGHHLRLRSPIGSWPRSWSGPGQRNNLGVGQSPLHFRRKPLDPSLTLLAPRGLGSHRQGLDPLECDLGRIKLITHVPEIRIGLCQSLHLVLTGQEMVEYGRREFDFACHG